MRKMKKITCLLTIALLATQYLMAQTGWIDVTDNYVKNPRFDNNSVDGWEGTTFGISGN